MQMGNSKQTQPTIGCCSKEFDDYMKTSSWFKINLEYNNIYYMLLVLPWVNFINGDILQWHDDNIDSPLTNVNAYCLWCFDMPKKIDLTKNY